MIAMIDHHASPMARVIWGHCVDRAPGQTMIIQNYEPNTFGKTRKSA
jgi:hypothetical protein